MINSKIMAGAITAAATVSVAIGGWAYSLSNSVAVNTDNVNKLENSVERLTEQYQRYDSQLAALIHRQDVRITLLESLVVSNNNNNKEV